MNRTCIQADWPAPASIVAGCTTRQNGISSGPFTSLNLGDHVGDIAEDVRENRRRFIVDSGLPAEPAWLSQVHGNRVVRDARSGTEADAVCSRRPGFSCAVLVADCLPVLFTNRDGSEIAAAHAGWRGLAAGILENTVASFDSKPAELLAWLGPVISAPAFEVGDEVREAFLNADPDAAGSFATNPRGRWQADLCGLARRRLLRAGVTRIYGGEFCTFTDSERFFSYRRDGRCGRMAAFLCRLE